MEPAPAPDVSQLDVGAALLRSNARLMRSRVSPLACA